MASTCDYLRTDVTAALSDLVRSAGFEVTAPVDRGPHIGPHVTAEGCMSSGAMSRTC
jgi:hypothetical protein